MSTTNNTAADVVSSNTGKKLNALTCDSNLKFNVNNIKKNVADTYRTRFNITDEDKQIRFSKKYYVALTSFMETFSRYIIDNCEITSRTDLIGMKFITQSDILQYVTNNNIYYKVLASEMRDYLSVIPYSQMNPSHGDVNELVKIEYNLNNGKNIALTTNASNLLDYLMNVLFSNIVSGTFHSLLEKKGMLNDLHVKCLIKIIFRDEQIYSIYTDAIDNSLNALKNADEAKRDKKDRVPVTKDDDDDDETINAAKKESNEEDTEDVDEDNEEDTEDVVEEDMQEEEYTEDVPEEDTEDAPEEDTEDVPEEDTTPKVVEKTHKKSSKSRSKKPRKTKRTQRNN